MRFPPLRPFALATLALALPPGSAAAAVTFGDSLGIPDEIIVPHPACGKPCTLATTISPEHLDWFRAPISGTIIRWRIQTVEGSDEQMLRLRVLAPVPGDLLGPAPSEPFTAAGSSEAVRAPTGKGTSVFPAQVPVRAGDFLGLDTEGALAAVAVEEESIRVFEPPPLDFGPAEAGIAQNYALLINADIAAPPHSEPAPGCSSAGSAVAVTVAADPDPAVSLRKLTVTVDGGETRTYALSGSRSTVQVPLALGSHTLQTRAEDSLGQLESEPRRTAVVCVAGAPSPLPGPVIAGPRITGLHLVRTARRTPRAVGWHDSLTARAAFRVERLVPGVLRGGVCVAHTNASPAGASRLCTRPLTLARFSHLDVAGENRAPLPRMRLKPGRYRLTGRAQVPGAGAGPASSIFFRVG